MTDRHVLRTGIAAAAVVVAMVALDTAPNVPVVAAMVLALGALGWLYHHLHDDLAPPPPVAERPDVPDALPDLRLTSLRQALVGSRSDGRLAGRIHRQLVAVVDDELRLTHGIERSEQPDAARAVLGPELDAFVSDRDVAERTTVRQLADIVERIEAL